MEEMPVPLLRGFNESVERICCKLSLESSASAGFARRLTSDPVLIATYVRTGTSFSWRCIECGGIGLEKDEEAGDAALEVLRLRVDLRRLSLSLFEGGSRSIAPMFLTLDERVEPDVVAEEDGRGETMLAEDFAEDLVEDLGGVGVGLEVEVIVAALSFFFEGVEVGLDTLVLVDFLTFVLGEEDVAETVFPPTLGFDEVAVAFPVVDVVLDPVLACVLPSFSFPPLVGVAVVVAVEVAFDFLEG